MGLFDKLLKEGQKMIEETVTEENKEKAAAFLNNLKDNLEEKAGEFKQYLEEKNEQAEQEETYYTPDEEDTRTCREKILAVLQEEFPAYTVKENVSPRELGGTGRFMDYSIVVYDGAQVRLIMMLIGKTTTSHREYRWSREFAESRGYAFINFIKHYPNRTDYISQRLHKYL
ncbi:MAG: hypothetical protein IKG15_09995 [Solobacterium sp.]|nr:hypothetical protein [Solobacterium sp.]